MVPVIFFVIFALWSKNSIALFKTVFTTKPQDNKPD